jgi:hypothetical protein
LTVVTVAGRPILYRSDDHVPQVTEFALQLGKSILDAKFREISKDVLELESLFEE